MGCLAGEAMVPSYSTNAKGWRVLPANHSLAGWIAPSKVQEEYIGKVGCALFICVDCSQHKIACGLSAYHIDLSLVGMATTRQVERQLANCSTGEAMVPSPKVESLLEDCTNSSATIIEGQREDNTEDIDACPQITNEQTARRQRRMEWQERGMFPSQEQWQQSFRNEG